MDGVLQSSWQHAAGYIAGLSPEPIVAVSDDKFVKDVELVDALSGESVLEQLVDYEAPSVEVLREMGRAVIGALPHHTNWLPFESTRPRKLGERRLPHRHPIDDVVAKLGPRFSISERQGEIPDDPPVILEGLHNAPPSFYAVGVGVVYRNWHAVPNCLRLSGRPFCGANAKAFRPDAELCHVSAAVGGVEVGHDVAVTKCEGGCIYIY